MSHRLLSKLLLGGLVVLFGCSPPKPYQHRQGVWYFEGQQVQLQPGERLTPLAGAFAKTEQYGYFRGVALLGSEGRSFEALSPHYAKDRQQVYYCDAFRDSQDYFFTQRRRVKVLKANPASFHYLKDNYARDSTRVFFEGKEFLVKDIDSFELLEYPYARDRLSGYFHQTPVSGSDGSSFAAINTRYSKDRNQVFYSFYDLSGKPAPKSVRLEGALVDSFEGLEGGYAKDAKRAYHNAKPLGNSASFEMLSLGYARTATQVFYEGKVVAGADAASFAVLETITEQADAKDKRTSYKQGHGLGKEPR